MVHRFLSLALLAVIVSGAGFGQESSVDAGRDALQTVLVNAGKFNGHMVVLRTVGSDGMPATETVGAFDFYRKGGSFFAEYNEFFGGGRRQISDGKVLLDDGWDTVVTVSDAPLNFDVHGEGETATGGNGFFFQSLGGEQALSVILAEKGAVKVTSFEDGEKLSFTHQWGGSVTVFAVGGVAQWVEYETVRQGFRGGGGTQVTRDTVVFRNEKYRFRKDMFSTKPLSGLVVQDQRKKG